MEGRHTIVQALISVYPRCTRWPLQNELRSKRQPDRFSQGAATEPHSRRYQATGNISRDCSRLPERRSVTERGTAPRPSLPPPGDPAPRAATFRAARSTARACPRAVSAHAPAPPEVEHTASEELDWRRGPTAERRAARRGPCHWLKGDLRRSTSKGHVRRDDCTADSRSPLDMYTPDWLEGARPFTETRRVGALLRRNQSNAWL